MAPLSDTSAPEPTLAATMRRAREEAGLSVRELARRAEVSHTQISRLESGQVMKPSREILVAIARALDRNPLPLLIVAGHFDAQEAHDTLRALFREGAELPEEWGDWVRIDWKRTQAILQSPRPALRDLRVIASDAFRVQETDETLWDDSYELAAARGEGAAGLREVMTIWRYLGPDRERWLEYGRLLRRVRDLEYTVEVKADQLTEILEENQ